MANKCLLPGLPGEALLPGMWRSQKWLKNLISHLQGDL